MNIFPQSPLSALISFCMGALLGSVYGMMFLQRMVGATGMTFLGKKYATKTIPSKLSGIFFSFLGSYILFGVLLFFSFRCFVYDLVIFMPALLGAFWFIVYMRLGNNRE